MKTQQYQQLQKYIPSSNNLMTNIKFLIFFGCGLIIGASLFTSTFPINVSSINNIFLNLRVINSTSYLPQQQQQQPSLPPPSLPPIPSLSEVSVTPPSQQLNETWVPPEPPKLTLLHNMKDEELLRKVSLVSKNKEYKNNTLSRPKIAFMFLVRGPLPLAPLWDKFFRGNEGLYTIYVHASPTYNHSYDENSVFHGRRIPSKPVEWGKTNMVEAERRLLANALLDESNQRFVLHSETCIPLFNFSTIYSYLINSTKSYIQIFDEKGPTGRGRYHHHMSPQIRLSQWRKGSQWFEMDRELALAVVSDRKYFPVFSKYCKRQCYGDEHYLPTYVGIKHWEKNSNRTVTWVDWSKIGPHPGKFGWPQITVNLLNKLRSNFTCEYNGEITNICYLFARKFMPGTLTRLLRFAPTVLKFG